MGTRMVNIVPFIEKFDRLRDLYFHGHFVGNLALPVIYRRTVLTLLLLPMAVMQSFLIAKKYVARLLRV